MNKPVALILAAGRGTRMQSSLPKVLHEVGDKTMIEMVYAAASGAGFEPVVIVGHKKDLIKFILPDKTQFIDQDQQLGTGHAVMLAGDKIPHSGVVLVMPGDAPLISANTLKMLYKKHTGLCTILTSNIKKEEAKSSGYGRVVRDKNLIREIVEASEATPEQLLITEFNTGFYIFDAAWLFSIAVPGLKPHPPNNEYYITDVIKLAAESEGLGGVLTSNRQEVVGINDKKTLNSVREIIKNDRDRK